MAIIGKALNIFAKPRRITFSSPTSFSLGIIGTPKWDGTIECSTDGQTWQTWDGTTSISSALIGNTYKLFVRGHNNTIITGESAGTDNGAWHFSGSDISISGDIMHLIDYVARPSSIGASAFKNLFGWKSPGDYAIVDSSNLIISGPLSVSCCNGMFSRCKGMLTVPQFPELNLANSCYQSTFYQCEGLVTLPLLKATTLPASCYVSMFNGCTSLGLYASSATGHTDSYRIPYVGTGTEQGSGETASTYLMFQNTNGDVVTPSINTTYYTNATIA